MDLYSEVFKSDHRQIVLFDEVGEWVHDKKSYPLYRAFMLDGESNSLDVNELVVAVKMIGKDKPCLNEEVRRASFSYRSSDLLPRTTLVSVKVKAGAYFDKEHFVMSLEYTKYGSIHNVMLRKFNGVMDVEWVTYVLKRVVDGPFLPVGCLWMEKEVSNMGSVLPRI